MSSKKEFKNIEDHYKLAALLQLSHDALIRAISLMGNNMRFDDKYLNRIIKYADGVSDIRSEMDSRMFNVFSSPSTTEKFKGIYYQNFDNEIKKEMAKKFLKEEGLINE